MKEKPVMLVGTHGAGTQMRNRFENMNSLHQRWKNFIGWGSRKGHFKTIIPDIDEKEYNHHPTSGVKNRETFAKDVLAPLLKSEDADIFFTGSRGGADTTIALWNTPEYKERPIPSIIINGMCCFRKDCEFPDADVLLTFGGRDSLTAKYPMVDPRTGRDSDNGVNLRLLECAKKGGDRVYIYHEPSDGHYQESLNKDHLALRIAKWLLEDPASRPSHKELGLLRADEILLSPMKGGRKRYTRRKTRK